MSDKATKLHAEAIVVVGHSDIVASDVDWRRESGERGVLDRWHLPTLRRGGRDRDLRSRGWDAPYGYLPATRLSTTYMQRFMRALDHAHAELEASEHFILAKTTADIRRAKREGKIAVVICLEGGAPLGRRFRTCAISTALGSAAWVSRTMSATRSGWRAGAKRWRSHTLRREGRRRM
jgi:microsomal dipeptidase-like Zn-dependent dipeptidase